MDFIRDGITNSLMKQWRNTLMYSDFSFRYVIIMTKHLCFAIIYIYIYICPFK
jgi:hypothetical protein